jgi:CubicO group peptidase (beta-lactamase class C family)
LVDHGSDAQVDRELEADLIALAGRRARITAAALVDLNASPNTRFALIDAVPETRFEVGSITKGLTGMLLADAIDRGEVSLDTTIGDLRPGDAETQFGSISLKELCTHTSGLPRMPRGLFTFVRGARFLLLGTHPYRRTTASGVLKVAARQRLSDRGQFRYSNLGGAVLGQLLALGAGADYAILMTERIFTPLAMTASVVAGPQHTAPPGWSSIGLRRPPWTTKGGFAPAGGVISTPRDMARLAVGLLDGSAPGSSSLTPIEDVATAGRNRASGMFWGIQLDPGSSNRRLIMHNGQTGGYSSFLGLAPHSGRAMIVLANVSRASDQQRIITGLAPHFATQVRSDLDD